MTALNITPITNDTYQFANTGNNVSVNGLNIARSDHPVGRLAIPGQFNGRTVTEIGIRAFQGRTGISAATIPNTVTRIGNNAFYNTGIWNNTPNNSVVYADAWAVGYKGTVTNSVGELTLRTTTAGIGDNAFSQASGLREAKIPNSVKSIGTGAFSNNSTFNRVWIPSSVAVIDGNAFAGCPSLTIYAQAASRPTGWNANWNPNNCPVIWNSPEAYKQPINQRDIPGVALPVIGTAPVTTITETSQYAGTVTWSPYHSTFYNGTQYTATITLTAKSGFTLQGVPANYFTVAGALSVSNAANSGVIRAVFPAIVSAYIWGVAAPVEGAMPVSTITGAYQYAGTVTWNPNHSTFAVGTQYTATITLTAKPGFTLQGVPADFFIVEGAETSNAANSGIVTAVFTGVFEAVPFLEFGFDYLESNGDPELYINRTARTMRLTWPFIFFSEFPTYYDTYINEWWDSGNRQLLIASFSLNGTGGNPFIGNGITFEGYSWGSMSSIWSYNAYPDVSLLVENGTAQIWADFHDVEHLYSFSPAEINRVYSAEIVFDYTGNL
jgi:hypothetical protein